MNIEDKVLNRLNEHFVDNEIYFNYHGNTITVEIDGEETTIICDKLSEDLFTDLIKDQLEDALYNEFNSLIQKELNNKHEKS